eukprot:COSAG01_NODE_147_length_24095_cov_25.855428_18_plen_115_part_00
MGARDDDQGGRDTRYAVHHPPSSFPCQPLWSPHSIPLTRVHVYPGVKRTVVSGLSWLWARAEGSLRTKTESSLVHWQQPLRTLYVGQHSCLLSTDTVRARTYYSTELTRLSCPL